MTYLYSVKISGLTEYFGVYEELAINGKEGGFLENKKQHLKVL